MLSHRRAGTATPLLLVTLTLALSPWIGSSARAEDNRPALDAAKTRYEHRKIHDPNGIGKFYMGREIAHVMGHQAAGWLERPERQTEENTDLLLSLLPIEEGHVVADIGAGSGYFTFPMSKRAGETGRIYAVDIQPEMLALIRRRAKRDGYTNIVPTKGTITDPKLPDNAIDLILLVDVYHEFSHPYEMVEKMVQSLKPGGKIVFVEYRLEDPAVPIKLVHKMSEAQVKREMEPFPLRWVETKPDLPWQHFIVFEKIDSDDAVPADSDSNEAASTEN